MDNPWMLPSHWTSALKNIRRQFDLLSKSNCRLNISLAKSFLAPDIRAVVITGLFPESTSVIRHKFERTQPLRTFPEIRCFQILLVRDQSHDAAQWITMVR